MNAISDSFHVYKTFLLTFLSHKWKVPKDVYLRTAAIEKSPVLTLKDLDHYLNAR
jgi:hypothetical protein